MQKCWLRFEFGSTRSLSLLETPGALDVALELGSLSKMYMVAGWRGGFVAGNAEVLAAVKAVHRQTAVLASSVIQQAGAVALESDQSTVAALAVQYQHRFEVVRDGFTQAGLPVSEAQGGLFAWAKVPERWGSAGVHDGTVSEVRVADGSADLANNSAAFVDWLLKTAGVALMPGSCFGKAGEGWVRISLLKHTADLFQAAARVSRALQDK